MESFFQTSRAVLTSAVQTALLRLQENLPDLFWAIVIIVVGMLLSAVLYVVILRLLRFFAIDKLAAKTPLQRLLRGMGVGRNVSEILALLVFWLGILVTFVWASRQLQVPEVIAEPLEAVTFFIPRLIAALIILILGMLLAKFLQTITQQTLRSAQITFAGTMSRAVYIIIVVYVIYLALSQLFDLTAITEAIVNVFSGILLVLLIGLLFICRHILEDAVACIHVRRLLKPGQKLSIGTTHGTVSGFTLTGVMVDTPNGLAVVPADDFFRTTYTITSAHGRDS